MKKAKSKLEFLVEDYIASSKENERFLTEKFAESDRQRKENERILNEKFAETRQFFKESREEHDRSLRESREKFERYLKESREEHDRSLKESREKFNLQMKELHQIHKETDLQIKETEKQMKKSDLKWEKLGEQMGGWANSHGSFAEEFFYNSFENGQQNFFGEDFDEIEKNLKTKKEKVQDEYDIVLFNHRSVAIVEVKFTVREKDIPKVLRKAETFRILFPEYKDFKIYLGLASLNFCKEMEDECTQKGIAVIKQVGEVVVIHDEHLKVF